MMVWEFSVNDWKFAPMSENPLLGVSGETLIKCGAKVTYKIVNEGQVSVTVVARAQRLDDVYHVIVVGRPLHNATHVNSNTEIPAHSPHSTIGS